MKTGEIKQLNIGDKVVTNVPWAGIEVGTTGVVVEQYEPFESRFKGILKSVKIKWDDEYGTVDGFSPDEFEYLDIVGS